MDQDIIIIHGKNGAGKTSLVEAIHYLCYVRSFKTRLMHELVHDNGADQFLLKGNISTTYDAMQQDHQIQIAYAHNKKKVKIDQKALHSYKELFGYCQVVTATQDDIEIIRGGPGYRRDFLDEAILLFQPSYLAVLKRHQAILDQRNALLHQPYHKDMYVVWTEKLFESTIQIQQARKSLIEDLQPIMQTYLQDIFKISTQVIFTYTAKWGEGLAKEEFVEKAVQLLAPKEHILQRSSFGAHLDEILLEFQGKNAKIFASRGQQRLLSLLLKIALIENLLKKRIAPIFVLDDVLADFDELKLEQIIKVLHQLKIQLIFTIPQDPGILKAYFQDSKMSIIEL